MKLLKYKIEHISDLIVNFTKLRLKKLSNPVLVYQMGKVASSSVYKSLKQVADIDLFHVHRLNPENIAKIREKYFLQGNLLPKDNQGIFLYDKLFKTPTRTVKIITLVREPIARNISAYFQNLQFFQRIKDAHDIPNIEQLIVDFIEKYDHNVPLEWFDVEMKSITDIDIYQHTFPQQQGHQVINAPLYNLLIMRHDLDDSLKEKCIAKFLGIESISLLNFNEASSKEYADVYKQLISSIKLPTEYVEKMLASKYAQHFYSPKELNAISTKWTGNDQG